MKIEVLQEQLMSGLGVVSRAVAVRAQLPILSHILIEARKEGLVLSATDLEIGMRVSVSAKVLEPGVVAVPAKMFGEFLTSLNPGKLELELIKETLVVTAPGYRGKFQTISAEEFPALSEIAVDSEICALEAKTLGEAVGRVVFASARDSLRPVLTGVLWEIGNKRLRLVSTDGFRLAIEDLLIENKKEEVSLLVPARVVLEVVRLSGGGEIKVGHLIEKSQIYFVVGDILITSQLLDGNFPDYTKIMPKEFLSEILVGRDELLQGIKAAHIFARDNSNMVKWSVAEGKLTLSAQAPERGECQIEIPVTLTGQASEIIFNAKFVLDYLSIGGEGEVWLGMGGKLAPGMFKDVKRSSGQYVVMPINA
jgi:DNA polymerase-3 subunit beta